MAFKKSVFLRSLELAKLSVKMATKEITSGNLESRLEQAKLLSQTLSQLKGAAMKAGQLISFEMADYFPPEAVEILGQLQNSASAAPFSEIQNILKTEWGEETLRQFTEIDEQPVASASIAQVHRAKWKNSEWLALKVQHQGVAESIDADISILKNLASTFCKITQRSMNLDPVFEELKSVLHQEVDFLKEAKYLELYQENLQKLQSENRLYFSPKPIKELTTQKVLTMSWEEGETLPQWLRSQPPNIPREHLAHLVLNLYCHEFFKWGLVQTDPNFTNFLIRTTQNEVGLVLLDFGSTRMYEKPMIDQYINLLKSVESGRPKQILQSAFEFGLLSEKESDESKQLFVAMMALAVEPFGINALGHSSKASETPGIFDFTNSDYSQRSQSVIKAFVRSLKYSPPPHRILFLHRKLGGIFSMLKHLKVSLNIQPYWELMISDNGKSDL